MSCLKWSGVALLTLKGRNSKSFKEACMKILKIDHQCLSKLQYQILIRLRFHLMQERDQVRHIQYHMPIRHLQRSIQPFSLSTLSID